MFMLILKYGNQVRLTYGAMLEMEPEIIFELEDSDIECVFTPDFRLSANYTDETKISWRLSGGRDACDVGFLCPELQDEITIYPSVPGRTDV